MTNKTVTLSRDLAERLDSPHSYARNLAREELRAALAEPVPHAGEEVDCEVCHGSGVLPGLTVKVTKCSYCGNGWKTIAQAEAELRLGDQAHVTRLQAELTSAIADKNAFAQNAIDLRAEVERLKTTRQELAGAVHTLTAELTKARECLKDLGVDWPEVSDMYQSAPAEEEHEHPY